MSKFVHSPSTEGESPEKGLDPQTGSAVKFEEGMGTTEGDASVAPNGTGDEQEGCRQFPLFFLAVFATAV